MPFLSKRLTAPSLAVLAIAAVPLVAPGAANAAMGGALPIQTSLRPDLISATIQNVDANAGTQTVRFTFDKNIGSQPTAANFRIGTYSASNSNGIPADSATRSGANTADAVFSATGDIDITQYTFAEIGAPNFGTSELNGAVNGLANGASNVPDATALIGSTTNNGTAGHTTGPDLTGITVNVGAQQVNYIFDQKINSAVFLPGFHIQNVDGSVNAASPTAASVAGNVATITFASGTIGVNMVRAYTDAAIVTALSDNTGNPLLSAARPGSGGFTNKPDLQSATVINNGGSIVFTYDQPVTAGTTVPVVIRSDGGGTSLTPDATITGGNSLGFTIGSGAGFNEYFVVASSPAGVATGAGGFSSAAGIPVGGNVGALGSGFAVAPEALKVTFDNATGVASVLLDQRFTGSSQGQFTLVDDTGNALAATPTNISGGGSPFAGQVTAKAQFTPAQLSGARGLLLKQGAVSTNLGYTNVTQALSPTATAAVLKKGSKVKFHKAHKVSKKQRRAFKRALRHR